MGYPDFVRLVLVKVNICEQKEEIDIVPLYDMLVLIRHDISGPCLTFPFFPEND